MIQNVNLMQNPEDIIFDKESGYSKEYLIQALANLGQRIGIKGDGIAYKSFTFNDISSLYGNYSSNEKIGYIEYIRDDYDGRIKALFGISDKNNLYKTETIDSSINIDNTLIFDTELSFSIPLCGIEKYSKNSLCVNKDNELTFILVCKKIGTNDDDQNNSVIIYYKFNILTNTLICCYKLFHFYENSLNENFYCLLNVNSTDNNNIYDLNINIFNSNELKHYTSQDYNLKENFENLFKFSNYNYGNPSGMVFSILNSDYIDVNSLLEYDDEKIEFNSVISLILNPSFKNQLYDSKKVSLIFNSNKNELLSENENYIKIREFFYKEYNLNLNEQIYIINDEINKLYVNIFKYYNDKLYLYNRSAFFKQILIKVYERSINFKEILNNKLYVPLDYEFHYICNSNNELNIYYSTNIYVTYTALNKIDLEEFWVNNNNLVFDYDGLNKLKVYNFEINYNTYIDELINSIVIKDVYTMPYINAENNWSINDTDTKIKAVGKDAGNPNIIIIYNRDINNVNTSFTIMNAISNKEKIIGATYKQKWIKLSHALFENTEEGNIECCSYIPEITDINYEYFKDSIIFSISDLDCLKNEVYKSRYKGSYILTLWVLKEDDKTKKMYFDCINQDEENYALALGATVNLFNELSDASIANLNSQDLLLLKAYLSENAQERLDMDMNNWLVIKNKRGEEYDQMQSMYNNDLNMIFQYDDQIKIETTSLVHSHSNSRYISDINNLSITNSLYPKYIYSEEEYNFTKEYIPIIIKSLSDVSTKTSNITIDGNTVTDVESLIEQLKTTEEYANLVIENLNTYKKSVFYKSDDNHYEYIFNSNIPTLDYKEIFNRNFNLLNRLNIISLDNNGHAYNAYIGTSYDESDKSTLHIGTSTLNINVGSDTLINEIDKNKFNTHDTLSIDFNNIVLNAKNKITSSNNLLYNYTVGTNNYTFTTLKLIGNASTYLNGNYTIKDNSYTGSLFAILKQVNNNVYFININVLMESINIKLSDYLYVNLMIKSPAENNFNCSYINSEYENSNIYLYKCNSNHIYTDMLDSLGILYSCDNAEIMYYESYNSDLKKQINIYLTIK